MRRCPLLLALALAACDRGAPAPKPRVTAKPAPDASAARQRPLTAAEIAMLRPIYQGSVDYGTVHVYDAAFTPFQGETVYMTPEGSIYAPGALWRDDFSADPDPYERAVFVHEMGHVWQFQNGMDMIAEGLVAFASAGGAYEKAYAYTLAPGADLLDYGLEQQASMLEDWYLIRVHGLAPTRMEDIPADDAARDALYAAVLGRFLADPGYARGVSAEEQFRRHVLTAKEHPPGAPGCGLPADQQKAPHLCNWRFDDR